MKENKPLMNKLCVHTITTKPLDFETACKAYAQRGIKGITIWKDAIENIPVKKVLEILKETQLEVVSYCRGGFFPSIDAEKRKKAIEDNKKLIEEAHAISAPILVLVCGADPAQPLSESVLQIKEGIEALLPLAEKLNVKLGIEPLHPMYADDRSAINTLKQANDLAEALDSNQVGVAVDVYHLWWDPELKKEIIRCGKLNKLFAFHICDWVTPTQDLLLDRGLMGDGCIPIKNIRSWVEETGYDGYNEVEIFSKKWWDTDQDVFLDKIIDAYQNKS